MRDRFDGVGVSKSYHRRATSGSILMGLLDITSFYSCMLPISSSLFVCVVDRLVYLYKPGMRHVILTWSTDE